MKKLLVLLLSLGLIFLAACAVQNVDQENAPATEEGATENQTAETAPDDNITTQVMTLKGPSGIGMASMIDQAAKGDTRLNFTLVGNPDEVVAAMTGGDTVMAAMPTNLAAKLYAKTQGDVVMLSIINYGNLYLLQNETSGDPITSLEDLRGQTIYATGQGSNPQYILEYLLTQAGLKVGQDVQVEYKSEHAELAALLASGEVNIAMLPEPFVTTVLQKNNQVVERLDLNDLWSEATGGGKLTLTCVAGRREFVEAHPQVVADFLQALEQSISAANSDVATTAQLCATYEIIASADVAEQAIPRCSLTFISGADMQPALEGYFQMLFDADPASLGGALPGDDFYYTGE